MSIVLISFRAIIAHFGMHHTSRLHLPSLIAMPLSTSTSSLTFVCDDENTNEMTFQKKKKEKHCRLKTLDTKLEILLSIITIQINILAI